MNNSNPAIKVENPDLKKKPTPALLKRIGKAMNDKKHPFNKVKLERKEPIENIFLKKNEKTTKNTKNAKNKK